jgi:hypothetical protein
LFFLAFAESDEVKAMDHCKKCGYVKKQSKILLCDGCDDEYHMDCLDPPITAVPEGDWFCPECVGTHALILLPFHSLFLSFFAFQSHLQPMASLSSTPSLRKKKRRIMKMEKTEKIKKRKKLKRWKTMMMRDPDVRLVLPLAPRLNAKPAAGADEVGEVAHGGRRHQPTSLNWRFVLSFCLILSIPIHLSLSLQQDDSEEEEEIKKVCVYSLACASVCISELLSCSLSAPSPYSCF